jgi:hypothetical protein
MAIDKGLLKSQRMGQGCRARRASLDIAKRRWYGLHRTTRLARLGQSTER